MLSDGRRKTIIRQTEDELGFNVYLALSRHRWFENMIGHIEDSIRKVLGRILSEKDPVFDAEYGLDTKAFYKVLDLRSEKNVVRFPKRSEYAQMSDDEKRRYNAYSHAFTHAVRAKECTKRFLKPGTWRVFHDEMTRMNVFGEPSTVVDEIAEPLRIVRIVTSLANGRLDGLALQGMARGKVAEWSVIADVAQEVVDEGLRQARPLTLELEEAGR